MVVTAQVPTDKRTSQIPLSSEADDSDMYLAHRSLQMKLLQAAQKAANHETTSSQGTWKTGGFVKRVGLRALKVYSKSDASNSCDDNAIFEQVVCAFDVVSIHSSFQDLRFVIDARQPPLNHLSTDDFEKVHSGFPAALRFERQQPHRGVTSFASGVFR